MHPVLPTTALLHRPKLCMLLMLCLLISPSVCGGCGMAAQMKELNARHFANT